jgi:uncharacterized protein YcbX
VTPPRVAQLWRYPVASMAGECVPRLRFARHAVVGDRAFALVSARTGRVLTARQVPQLASASARWFGCEAQIRLPDGSRFRSSDPAACDLLSDWLGRAVRLARPPAPAPASGPGARVHLLDEGSLRAAHQRHPRTPWTAPRPHIVVAGPEDALAHRLAVGDAVLELTGPGERRAPAPPGVRARILRPGSVTVNDTLDPLPTAASAQPARRA